MEADEARRRGADVALEGGLLLLVVEDFVVGVVEDQGLVALEVVIGEHCGVVGDLHGEVVFRAEFLDGSDAGGDVVVNVALAIFGIDQNAAGGGRAEGDGAEGDEEDEKGG